MVTLAAFVVRLCRVSLGVVAIAIVCGLLSTAFIGVAKAGAKDDTATLPAMRFAVGFALLAFILLVFAALNYPPLDRHSRPTRNSSG